MTLGLVAVAALAAPAPAQATARLDLVSPAPVDPLIELLAAYPTPYTPYAGDACVSGGDACIGAVVDEMQRRLDGLAATCSHHAIFSLAYLRVTENVRDAVNTGYFDDRVWLRRLDTHFADLYFATMDDWSAGRTVAPAWQVALRAADDHEMTGLGDFMLNMNAHINNDFPRALAYVGLTAADGTSHKSDHNRYNQRLDSLYAPVFAEEAARFDPAFDDIDAGPFEETAAGLIMRGWREAVWRNAEALANARTPAERAHVSRWIDQYAATQAEMIRAMPIFRATASSDVARSDWCAAHHG